ncbi:MAG: YraN family protein [Candidatus Omnitrophica bacterium]|nr:YraN family protein [Candidatus Omnitrophota bacterium]
MDTPRRSMGQWGEELARNFLCGKGFRILACNYRNRYGEIDIIAQEKRTVCFIEVKTRRGEGYGAPAEAVNRRKQRRISQLALVYLKSQPGFSDARFDVVEVMVDRQMRVRKIEIIRDAFPLSADFFYAP